jgi:hypothetical protein
MIPGESTKMNSIGLKAILSIPILVCLLGSCAQVPVPATYRINTQKKIQAAYHWDVLASDVAEQAYLFLSQDGKLQDIPIYVAAAEDTLFDGVFRDLLITQLVQQGVTVVDSRDNALTMTYRAQLLRHGKRTIRQPPSKYSALALGIKVARDIADWATEDILNVGVGLGVLADLNRGATTGGTPDVEVILTTSMLLNNRYVNRKSDIYYINEPDGWHYDGDEDNGAKTYHVVN